MIEPYEAVWQNISTARRWSVMMLRCPWLIASFAIGLSCATTRPTTTTKTTTRDYIADRILPGSKVRMVVSLDEAGAALRFFVEQVCVSETKRTTTEGTATNTETVDHHDIRCNRRPLVSAGIVVKDVHGAILQTGTTTSGGAWTLNWADLTPLQLMGLSTRPALVDVEGKGTVGTIVLDAAQAAGPMTQKVKSLAANDKVDEAQEATRLIERMGADATEARAAIAVAPTMVERRAEAEKAEKVRLGAEIQAEIQQHVALAKRAIERDDPESAMSELDQAETRGEDVTALRQAAKATPKGRRLARETERIQKREDQQERAAGEESALPFAVGDSWRDDTLRLMKLGSAPESKHLPGSEVLGDNVTLQTPIGIVEGVAIESLDQQRVSRITLRFSQSLTTHCGKFNSDLRKMLGNKWGAWKTKAPSNRYAPVEGSAKVLGEQELETLCGGAGGGAYVKLWDAWTLMRVNDSSRDMGHTVVVGEVVWNKVTNFIAASKATNLPVTEDDILRVGHNIYEILETAKAANGLSPRSREAYNDFLRLVGSVAWLREQFLLGLRMTQ
jgi:hypothetical protein